MIKAKPVNVWWMISVVGSIFVLIERKTGTWKVNKWFNTPDK